MNRVSLTHKLRGQINLKLCAALAAVALTGVFVVRLPAQNKPAQNNKDCLDCGTTKAVQGENLKLFVPQKSKLMGTITGPFKDFATRDITSRTIALNATDPTFPLGAEALKDGMYKINLTASSADHDIYGIALGKDETAEENFVARLSEKSHVVQLAGTISGATIQGSTLQWGFLSERKFNKPKQALTQVSGGSGQAPQGEFH